MKCREFVVIALFAAAFSQAVIELVKTANARANLFQQVENISRVLFFFNCSDTYHCRKIWLAMSFSATAPS